MVRLSHTLYRLWIIFLSRYAPPHQKNSTTSGDDNTGNKNKKLTVEQKSSTTPVDVLTDNKENYINKITLEEEFSEAPAEENTGINKERIEYLKKIIIKIKVNLP